MAWRPDGGGTGSGCWSVAASIATLGIVYEPLGRDTAELAGELWRSYCLALPGARNGTGWWPTS